MSGFIDGRPDVRGLLHETFVDAMEGAGTSERRKQHRAQGSKCLDCGDTGMAGATFCGCPNGAKLAQQAFGQ